MKKQLTAVLCAAAMLLSQAVLVPAQEGGEETSGHLSNLVIGTTASVENINMVGYSGIFGTLNYLGFIRGNWVYKDGNTEIQPYFMTSFEISEDGKVLDFTFPTDAVWGDGEPVTGEDVVFTFEFYKDTMLKSTLRHMESIELTGEGSARLTFSEPDAYAYLTNAALNDGCIPKHIWESHVGGDDYYDYMEEDASIGCGAYKLISRDLDAGTMYFEAIPQNNYHGEITVDSVTVKSYANQEDVLMALINGEVDCYYRYSSPISHTLIGLLDGEENIDPGKSYNSGQNQITFGMSRPAFSDYQMRLAATKAFNWELLASLIGGEYGEIPNTSLLAPSCIGFNADLPKFERNLEEANQILDEAGYKDVTGDGLREFPDGSEMKILVVPQYSSDMSLRNRIAEILIDNLKEAGIDAYVDESIITNDEIWEENIEKENYDIAIGYTTVGVAKNSTAFRYYVADLQADAVEKNAQTQQSSTWTWGAYHDPDFTEHVWNMVEATSPEEYVNGLQWLQQEANDVLFGTSLCWEMAFYPFRTDKIEGWNNWMSWGVVNNDTWTSLHAK